MGSDKQYNTHCGEMQVFLVLSSRLFLSHLFFSLSLFPSHPHPHSPCPSDFFLFPIFFFFLFFFLCFFAFFCLLLFLFLSSPQSPLSVFFISPNTTSKLNQI